MAGRRTTKDSAETRKEAFTRQQLAESKRYRAQRDLLTALLDEDKTYTTAETDEIFSGYLGKKVN